MARERIMKQYGRSLSAGVLALAGIWLAPAGARAEEGPYSNFLVGERSLGLGGAFVAVADDSSATFHNPGGIAALHNSSAAGSMFTLLWNSRDVELGYETSLGSINLEHDESQSFPSFLAGVVKFGPRGPDRIKPHAFGASLLTPRSEEYHYLAQLEGDDPDLGLTGVDRLDIRQRDRARWLGISYGYRPSPRLSLGFSGFMALRSWLHDEVELRTRSGDVASIPDVASESRATGVSASSRHAVLRLGALWNVAYDLRFGLMLQPPGLLVSSSGELDRLVTRAGAAGTTFESAQDETLVANLPLPWEVRLGASYIPSEQTLLTVDLSVLGPSGNQDEPLPLVETTRPAFELGAFVPMRTYRRLSVRGALGFESRGVSALPLRGGLLVESSSSPPVPARSDVYVRPSLYTLGGAFSVAVRTDSYDLSIGAIVLHARGEDMALVRTPFDATPEYWRRHSSGTTLLVFITGAKSAVKTLVQTITEE